jgi:hypothetical protein
MSSPSSPPPRLCIRCRQPLPKDVTFCVGCGCQNEPDAVHGRKLQAELEAESRVGFAKFMQGLISPFRWFR